MVRALPVAVLLLVLSAGCVTVGSGPSTPTGTTGDSASVSDASDVSPATDAPGETPLPQSVLGNGTARTRALDAEEDYVTRRLRNADCVDSWGVYDAGGSRPKEATVLDRRAEGVVVNVTHPFWWGNERVDDDDFSKAAYRITTGDTHRISGRTIDPC